MPRPLCEAGLGPLDGVEAGVLIDLFLSYRAVSAWQKMVALYGRLPKPLQNAVLLREQLGFSLNRLGRRDEALGVLQKLEDERGPRTETSGLIGRVYKDSWSAAKRAGNAPLAAGYLRKAIDAYVRGFESDSRDAYPGINAVTLLDVQGTPGALSKKDDLLPVVRFAVNRRVRGSHADYWDLATLLELAVLEGDRDAAEVRLSDALAARRKTGKPRRPPTTWR